MCHRIFREQQKNVINFLNFSFPLIFIIFRQLPLFTHPIYFISLILPSFLLHFGSQLLCSVEFFLKQVNLEIHFFHYTFSKRFEIRNVISGLFDKSIIYLLNLLHPFWKCSWFGAIENRRIRRGKNEEEKLRLLTLFNISTSESLQKTFVCVFC